MTQIPEFVYNPNLEWMLNYQVEKMTAWWKHTAQLTSWLYQYRVELTAVEVSTAILAAKGFSPDMNIRPLDWLYRTYPRWAWEKYIIPDDRTNLRMPWPEKWDCDDFALDFKAKMASWYNTNAAGLVVDSSAGHVYNVIVFADRTAEFFEPQRDKFVAKGDQIGLSTSPGGTGRYSLTQGLILV